jgi:DnaJ-class molecular chaperone
MNMPAHAEHLHYAHVDELLMDITYGPQPTKRRCPACHGLKVVMGKDGETKTCWKCDGTGEIEE